MITNNNNNNNFHPQGNKNDVYPNLDKKNPHFMDLMSNMNSSNANNNNNNNADMNMNNFNNGNIGNTINNNIMEQNVINEQKRDLDFNLEEGDKLRIDDVVNPCEMIIIIIIKWKIKALK